MECGAKRSLMSNFTDGRYTWWIYGLKLAVIIMQHSLVFSALVSNKPMNTVSVLGNMVNMECIRSPSHLPVDWKFASPGSNNFSYIYTAGRITENLISRYKIDTDNRTRYDIVIDSVDLYHAGTYICTPITEEFSVTSASTELIVLASDPVCNTNASLLNGDIVEGDYIRMWCTVNYTGYWIPVMEWTRSNGQTVDTNIVYTNTSTTVTSSLTVQLYLNDNGATFTCKTHFKPTSAKTSIARRPWETLATNVPHYQHLWNFKPSVLYTPRNLAVIPKKKVYEVGDHLMCWADGNPTPIYEWMETETNRTIHGSVLTFHDNMRSDKNRSFRCTAYNTVTGIRRQITETLTLTIKGTVTQISCEANVIALTAAGVIAVIGLVGLGLGVALTVKACTKSNSVNRGSSDKPSTQHQDYEMVDESNIQPGDGENLPLNQSTPHKEDGTEDHSAEAIACEGYASLKRSSSATFVQPSVYAQLQLYANISSSE